MAGFITTTIDVSKNWNTYDKYSENLYLKNKKKAKLIKENPEYKIREENIKEKANTIINAVKILDNQSENYAENIEMAVGSVAGIADAMLTLPFTLAILRAKSTSKTILYTMASFIPSILFSIILAPLEAKVQVLASRLGRNKVMSEELSDINNFVEYTPEQIKKATETIEKTYNSDAKAKNNNSADSNQSLKESLNQIINFSKEYKIYKAEKEKEIGINNDFQAKLEKKYSKDEILRANEDKELILHVSRIINNKAEDYSENTENAFQTLNMLEGILMFPVIYLVNKIIDIFSSKKNAALNKSIGSLVSLTFLMTLIVAGTSMQKNAARVGRYKAQQDLKKDISPVVYFDDKELETAGDVENDYKKIGFIKKIFNNLLFLKTYFKDLKEFKKYKKTEAKKEYEIFEELKNMEKSSEQIKKAEELQKKTFFAFKEIDEMSQSYSENMEATTNILNTLLITPFNLAPTIILYGGLYQILEGKLNIPKYANLLANFTLDKNSIIRTSLNDIYKAGKQDKSIKKLINQAFNPKERTKAFEELLKKESVKEPISELINHIQKILPDLNNNMENVIRSEVKNNKFTNYLINLAKDFLNFITASKEHEINKLKKAGKYTPNIQDEIVINIRKQLQQSGKIGKTLKNTLLIGTIPVLSVILFVPFAISSIFTNIQKKSGRIGVMKATNKLDKAEYFT